MDFTQSTRTIFAYYPHETKKFTYNHLTGFDTKNQSKQLHDFLMGINFKKVIKIYIFNNCTKEIEKTII